MPGRHGKQQRKRKRSKRQPVTEMETTLKDSIHQRTRNEREILKDLVPLRAQKVVHRVQVSALMPLFSQPPSCLERDCADNRNHVAVSSHVDQNPTSPKKKKQKKLKKKDRVTK